VFEAMVHDLRVLLRWLQGRTDDPTAAILDSRTLPSTPESGSRAGYDGHTRKNGSKIHVAVDTVGDLLALHVTPANVQDWAQVATLAAAVQDEPGQHVAVACGDQGYPGTPRSCDRVIDHLCVVVRTVDLGSIVPHVINDLSWGEPLPVIRLELRLETEVELMIITRSPGGPLVLDDVIRAVCGVLDPGASENRSM
jgi:hypothetical protein